MNPLEISIFILCALIAAYFLRGLWISIHKDLKTMEKQVWRQVNKTYDQLYADGKVTIGVKIGGVYKIGSIVMLNNQLWERIK